MTVFFTDNGDGSAEATVQFADEDHRFTIVERDDEAVVEYEETLSWRGEIRVAEPDEEVYKDLMVSDEVTSWLNERGLSRVRREKRHP